MLSTSSATRQPVDQAAMNRTLPHELAFKWTQDCTEEGTVTGEEKSGKTHKQTLPSWAILLPQNLGKL